MAYLRSISSVELDVRNQSPADNQRFCVLIDAEIGPSDSAGADIFRVHVCTPSWLAERVEQIGHEWGRGYLIVQQWEIDVIQKAIERLVSRRTDSEWETTVAQLVKWMSWEFEK